MILPPLIVLSSSPSPKREEFWRDCEAAGRLDNSDAARTFVMSLVRGQIYREMLEEHLPVAQAELEFGPRVVSLFEEVCAKFGLPDPRVWRWEIRMRV